MRFDQPVAAHGYRWWYVDALSDVGTTGGRCALTIIAFLGSVFSPWYALSRRFGDGDPLQHCSMHVALTRLGDRAAPRRWAMTEHGADAVVRDASMLRIGRSRMRWDNARLVITLDERTLLPPGRVRGTVTVHPAAFTGFDAQLSEPGNHHWTPLSPRARIEVDLDDPQVRWSGDGYLDGNHGDGPIETAFCRWHWCRAQHPGGSAILYEVERRDGSHETLSLAIDAAGQVRSMPPPPQAPLPASRWGIARTTRSDDGWARVRHTLLDSPFYARSVIESRLLGHRGLAMHESLDCNRFANPLVQAMLPFRVPKASAFFFEKKNRRLQVL